MRHWRHPEWEVKEALGLHLSLDAEHAASLRQRIGEMRSPTPRLDVTPDEAIDRFFEELLTAGDTLEKLVGLYGVLKPALIEAYQEHYRVSSPVIDYPTRRMLKHILLDEEDSAAWGVQAVAAVTQSPAEQERAASWIAHLQAYLQAAGGIMGVQERRVAIPEPRARGEFSPDYFPQRDERFSMRWNFSNPQRQVSLNEEAPLDERTLALMCRRIVEMDVPEYMTRIIIETEGGPWEYILAMTRQLWDEVHAMMGTIYFERMG
jgi:hypothetical protein